jgi:hypothetical protein
MDRLVLVLLENVRLAFFGHMPDGVGQRFAMTGSILPWQSSALP